MGTEANRWGRVSAVIGLITSGLWLASKYLGRKQALGINSSCSDFPGASRNLAQIERWYHRFFQRIDPVSAIIGAASILIAVLALRVSTDTSKVQEAISELTELVKQTSAEVKASSDQVSEMKAEQRPWVFSQSVQLEGMKDTADGFSVQLRLHLVNSGKLPASNIWVGGAGVPLQHATGGGLLELARKACAGPLGIVGPSIFPGEQRDMPYTIDLDLETSHVGMYIIPELVVCIKYRDLVGVIHHTPYFLTLTQPGRSDIRLGTPDLFKTLTLEQEPSGGDVPD